MKTIQCKTLYKPSTNEFVYISSDEMAGCFELSTDKLPQQSFTMDYSLPDIIATYVGIDNWEGIELITINVTIL